MKTIHVILLFLLVVGLVQAQQQTPPAKVREAEEDVIRVDTSLVTLPVKVTNRDGKVAYGLQSNQFRVFENGVEQEVVFFEAPQGGDDSRQNAKPLTVALMLDVSDSTELKLGKIKDAALMFIDLLRPTDRVLLVSFDKEVSVLAEATADRKILRETIQQIQTGGGTSLYAALVDIMNRPFSRAAGPKAIVLLTDGVDTTSRLASFESSIRVAETSDVAIFPVQYHTYSDFVDNPSRAAHGVGSFGTVSPITRKGELASDAYRRATQYLRLLADKTAGRFQFADSEKKLVRSFETIATQLREQYMLGYYPTSKVDERRQIEVKVLVPQTKVRTRKSYIYRTMPGKPRQ